ncbi:Ni/Fe hydrogenase [Thioalkalivibrio denitrificans]|uniref:hydrogenase (acceptor) n=1 Tax=Thioalkalivibrio denitrificans TaxID=108003 RepID=A0A1V3NBN8_9GAMM|nr:hydrogenase small subunit [Thioalkalivibrio denitrificans]OOG22441.1 Ni/Fe hydrogenase [Thioalkalivibrio denitrificans]
MNQRKAPETLGEELRRRGMSRRTFLKFCAALASSMALPASMAPVMADALAAARRQSVIWLSFQECTGCVESLTRSYAPTLESLIFDFISLDYQHTLQAAAGHQVEAARETAMKENWGKYLAVVDGSIPLKDGGVYSTVAGETNLDTLRHVAEGAAAIISVGTCAAYGGLPKAHPNPTGAAPVTDIIRDKPVINVPGCPPIPEVLAGVIANFLTLGRLPEMDALHRPLAFFGETVHERCYRRPFFRRDQFAKSFDDEGARNGWCLYELGCKGPETRNACATTKWNRGVSFPIESGHGCIGCSEPDFWDKGSFYAPLPRGRRSSAESIAAAAQMAAGTGIGGAMLSRASRKEDLEDG